MNARGKIWPTATLIVAGILAAGCGESGDIIEPDINPGLLETSSVAGLAAGGDLPQGSAAFTGPGGLAMDATAEEFVQQLTLVDGTVWQTSGVSVRAVPDEAITGAPIEQLSFVSANTGSLASVSTGTYALSAEWPAIDFINQVEFAGARIRQSGTHQDYRANSGTMTIQSLNYFDDVYPCSLSLSSITVDECEYQLGIVRGFIEFSVPLDDGSTINQDRTEFTVPIMRRTIIARMN